MTLSRHLSYANVASTLAVVLALALGGGGAAVAGGLGKNSVGSKQIRPASVKLVDLAPDAVDSTRIVANSVNGSDVAESTLGKVPSAASADTAITATSALSAGRSTNVLRATVTAGGAIAPGQSDPGVSATAVGGGGYRVVFGRNVTACTQVVGLGEPGFATANSLPGEPRGVSVTTYDIAGTGADRSFALVVVC